MVYLVVAELATCDGIKCEYLYQYYRLHKSHDHAGKLILLVVQERHLSSWDCRVVPPSELHTWIGAMACGLDVYKRAAPGNCSTVVSQKRAHYGMSAHLPV